jgi:hypothetical protein
VSSERRAGDWVSDAAVGMSCLDDLSMVLHAEVGGEDGAVTCMSGRMYHEPLCAKLKNSTMQPALSG